MVKRIIIASVFMSVCVFANAGKYVAKVNGEKITKSEIEKNLWAKFSKSEIESSVAKLLVLQKAKQLNVTVADAEVDKLYSEIESRYASSEEFKSKLKEKNISPEDVRDEIYTQQIKDELIIRLKDISITDEQTREVFDKNKDVFGKPERAHLKQIVFAKEADANDTIKELENGRPFEELAKERSLDRESAVKGGDIGVISRPQLVDDIAEKVFALKKGQYSKPIVTPNGYYVLKMEEKLKAEPANFDETKEIIKQTILKQEIAKETPSIIQQLKKEADIEIYS
ncbi:MAG TPA: peptidyl-prolyl cis-trans isomerase [Elusimicrobiales bacterium]|nr:peptidyl-prolyl cis-trans isomerase [Elusimicrobiales bacterium]